ncbi:MAG: acetylornithine/succinylornithine family transaminase [Solirubrobacterales bacterium]|jgi:acetylornithine/N-succinyldiaminopimelate aminotransferase|nr:acetylornithine/succinylornithine family transaminase [Solirubrobacterales bacterium]
MIDDSFLTANYARQPVEFVRGEGARLWDADGHEYLDLQTGLAVNSVGHCHPAVVAAVQAQAAQLIHVGNLFYTDPMVRLAERLARASQLGDGTRVFFTNSGTEAVEAALKCARKRRRAGTIISVHRGFHGRTYGALSATPQESKQAPFAPLVPGFIAVEPTAEAITAAVDGQTAAVILEPVQGESGVYPLPREVLQAARDACDAHGAALIYDEIQCGLGRTGTMWAWEDTCVRPDAVTVAKALAGGLPIGALIAGPEMANVFEPGDHGSTFAGGPVQCAAGLAVLDILAEDGLLLRVREAGERLTARLAELPHVREVRGRGFMQAIELDGVDALALVGRALQEERLVLNATSPSTLRLLPPLVVTDEQLDDAVIRLTRLL